MNRRTPPPPGDPSQVHADREALKALYGDLQGLKPKLAIGLEASRRLERGHLGEPALMGWSRLVDCLLDLESERQACEDVIETVVGL